MTHEGGYANLANDPGGKTRYGITEAVARENGYVGDMRELPLEKAKEIAKAEYWTKCYCDMIPYELRYPLFDAAYHSGVKQSIKWLQSALGVKVDGNIGPITIGAAQACNALLVRQQMIGKRLRFMTELKNWPSFAKGWSRRISSILEM
jgi:lysozyme family protein